MPRRLTPAPEALFWYWISERHRIYLKRAAGEAKPWSDDPILQTYKFTNVFRQLDRGTVWLTDNFITPHWGDDPGLLVGNIGWYRLFNWTGTGQLLGWRKVWRTNDVTRLLTRAQSRGDKVFTGAHIVWSARGKSKIRGVSESAAALWAERNYIASVACHTRSLSAVFEVLRDVRGIGGFIAYEIVSDLRHTPVLNGARDINTFANVGPGALRGLRRMFPDLKPSDALPKMRELLEKSRAPGVLGAHVPPLELRDVEHSSCEFDKMCRVKYGEGRPRSTYDGGETACASSKHGTSIKHSRKGSGSSGSTASSARVATGP